MATPPEHGIPNHEGVSNQLEEDPSFLQGTAADSYIASYTEAFGKCHQLASYLADVFLTLYRGPGRSKVP